MRRSIILSRSGLRLGISTHCESELARALGLGPSYVAIGPIFPTTCKSMAFGPHGLPKISKWRQMTDLPLVAIGGMKPVHIAEACGRGASGIAVISDVLEDPHPEERCREWLAGIRQALATATSTKDHSTNR